MRHVFSKYVDVRRKNTNVMKDTNENVIIRVKNNDDSLRMYMYTFVIYPTVDCSS